MIKTIIFISGCGTGRYMDINLTTYTIGSDRCHRFVQVSSILPHVCMAYCCDVTASSPRDVIVTRYYRVLTNLCHVITIYVA